MDKSSTMGWIRQIGEEDCTRFIWSTRATAKRVAEGRSGEAACVETGFEGVPRRETGDKRGSCRGESLSLQLDLIVDDQIFGDDA